MKLLHLKVFLALFSMALSQDDEENCNYCSACARIPEFNGFTGFAENAFIEEKVLFKSLCIHSAQCTLFEIFIFCPKIQLWFPEKIVDFFGWKTRENVVILDFLAVDNFDFTRKIVKKIWVKNSWKCWGFVKIEFLDNLTFRIVCRCNQVNFLNILKTN